jgi:two-component system chemotaxis response regulator CheY
VLLVGADDDVAYFLASLIADEGHTVARVRTLDAGTAATGAHDVVLVDGLTRSRSALDPTEAAALDALGAVAPVVLVSGWNWVTQARPEDLGVAAVLAKPYDVDELVAALQQAAGGVAAEGTGALRRGPRGPVVLVVDDDAAIRETVSTALDLEGYEVSTAADGALALEAVERVRPCLVLLDMRMPVLDGWGVAAALRARGVRVPIAVMTAAADAQRWCDEIGADACVPKPFDLDHLLDTVARLCAPPGTAA